MEYPMAENKRYSQPPRAFALAVNNDNTSTYAATWAANSAPESYSIPWNILGRVDWVAKVVLRPVDATLQAGKNGIWGGGKPVHIPPIALDVNDDNTPTCAAKTLSTPLLNQSQFRGIFGSLRASSINRRIATFAALMIVFPP
jgi:hypothetical protein